MWLVCGRFVAGVGRMWAMWLVCQPHLALGVTRSIVVCVVNQEQQTRRCGLDEAENAGYGVLRSYPSCSSANYTSVLTVI